MLVIIDSKIQEYLIRQRAKTKSQESRAKTKNQRAKNQDKGSKSKDCILLI